jgi:hypothetical protein
MDPHHFGKSDPDLHKCETRHSHQSQKQDPDPHHRSCGGPYTLSTNAWMLKESRDQWLQIQSQDPDPQQSGLSDLDPHGSEKGDPPRNTG